MVIKIKKCLFVVVLAVGSFAVPTQLLSMDQKQSTSSKSTNSFKTKKPETWTANDFRLWLVGACIANPAYKDLFKEISGILEKKLKFVFKQGDAWCADDSAFCALLDKVGFIKFCDNHGFSGLRQATFFWNKLVDLSDALDRREQECLEKEKLAQEQKEKTEQEERERQVKELKEKQEHARQERERQERERLEKELYEQKLEQKAFDITKQAVSDAAVEEYQLQKNKVLKSSRGQDLQRLVSNAMAGDYTSLCHVYLWYDLMLKWPTVLEDRLAVEIVLDMLHDFETQKNHLAQETINDFIEHSREVRSMSKDDQKQSKPKS